MLFAVNLIGAVAQIIASITFVYWAVLIARQLAAINKKLGINQ